VALNNVPSPKIQTTAAALVLLVDGFDGFSLSLMAPAISRELAIPTASLGPVFASAMLGMVLGAFVGGALADRLGRLKVLLVAVGLFSVTSLAMPWVGSAGEIMFNRLLGGIGLGAAGPIAISLLNRSASKPPSELVVAIVLSGISLGGSLAALFNYAFATSHGWRLMFIVGGLAPIPIAIFALVAFRGAVANMGVSPVGRRPGITTLFNHGRAGTTLLVGGMFFFGYVPTVIVAQWLPTILSHRAASPLMISGTFAAISAGGLVANLVFGALAARGTAGRVRTLTWGLTAAFGFAAAVTALNTDTIALLAVVSAIIGTAGLPLSIALANRIYADQQLQATTVGFMTGVGRIGQVFALGLSGALVSFAGQEMAVFTLGGAGATLAALFSALLLRRAPVLSPHAKGR
jgi:MFS transporter, AAHS family, 4-hydroxybenzoate transporter